MAPAFGYWEIRGLGQAIRLLLHYCGEDFEEKRYTIGPGPEFNADSWFGIKFTLGLPFPNLPYYIDGDVKLTESKAILRHIGRKNNLLGNTATEMAQVDMLLDVTADSDLKATRVFYSKDMDASKAELLEGAKLAFKKFEEFGKDKTWLTGDNITVADFFLYEHCKRMTAFEASLITDTDHGWLKGFMKKFEELPAIKKYMDSAEFIKSPFNGPMATWSG